MSSTRMSSAAIVPCLRTITPVADSLNRSRPDGRETCRRSLGGLHQGEVHLEDGAGPNVAPGQQGSIHRAGVGNNLDGVAPSQPVASASARAHAPAVMPSMRADEAASALSRMAPYGASSPPMVASNRARSNAASSERAATSGRTTGCRPAIAGTTAAVPIAVKVAWVSVIQGHERHVLERGAASVRRWAKAPHHGAAPSRGRFGLLRLAESIPNPTFIELSDSQRSCDAESRL